MLPYTDATFRAYLASVLHEVGPVLGWNPGSPQVVNAADDALLEYGASEIGGIASTDDLRTLRALGRRAIWRGVVQAVASKYDFSDSDAKFTRSQIQAMAKTALDLAEQDCAAAGASGSGVSIGRLTLDFLEPAPVQW